jgi:hypothetical protein
VWVRRSLDGVEKLHVGDVIDIDLFLQDNGQAFPVQLDGEDGRREGELAYCRLPLVQGGF